MASKMRAKSKKSAERRPGEPDGTGSGKDLGNSKGFAHSRITAHSRLRGWHIQPRPTIPSRLSFPAGFSSGYRRLRNTGFTRSTRSQITRRTEKEPVFFRPMSALLPGFCNRRRVRIPGIQLRQTKVILNRS